MALPIRKLAPWGYLSLATALSILELMLIGLLGPLTKVNLSIEIGFLVFILAIYNLIKYRHHKIKIPHFLFFNSRRDIAYAFVPVIFIPLAIFGSFSLNNGGNNILTIVMLAGIACYFVLLFTKAQNINDTAITISLFFLALALLFMTSLRGWYITGHDIQIEYKVFQLTKNLGLWTMASYQDAYNACLSITILPTIFSRFINSPDPYIYKVYFQIIFAVTPGIMYLISRNWLNRKLSLLTAIYFVAFPTFFGDMPFLIRQEIAFIFFGLMIYAIFNKIIDLKIRRIVFVVLGLGVILSHYSTTYTILAILILLVITTLILRVKNIFITPLMVAILVAINILWTVTITNTGGNAVKVASGTLTAIKNGFLESSRSSDAAVLFTLGSTNQNQQASTYLAKYGLTLLESDRLPLTTIGLWLTQRGIVVATLVPQIGQLLIKVLEVLTPIGIIYIFLPKSVFKNIDKEYILLSVFSLVFIGLNVILPVLSTEYGVFRALQQSMFVIAPFMVLGSAVLGTSLIPIALAELFFLYSTAFIPQLFGGNLPQLHLNNQGTYFDEFLTQTTDYAGISWLNNALINSKTKHQPSLRADKFAQNKILSVTNLGFVGNIFPSDIEKNSFVYLDSTHGNINFGGEAISYVYPIASLNSTKNLIYNNGKVRIYR
jgi:uncharacterized membrane protein